MILARSGLRRSRDLAFLLVCGLVFALSPARDAKSSDWNREAARAAWVEAEKLLEALSSSPEPSRESYLKCIRTYQQVYTQDPHYGYSPDAVFQAGKLYQTMGDKYSDPSYYRNAARLYRFLTTDYGQSPRCPEALLRLGTMSAGPLKDEQAAQDAYQRLRTVYSTSAAAATLAARSEVAGKPAPLSVPAPPVVPQVRPQVAGEAAYPVAATAIRSIGITPLGNGTRISVVSDGEIKFSKGTLSNPERIYFDIKDVRLDPSLLNKILSIEDKFVKKVRIAQFRPDLVRIVFDLSDVGEVISSEKSETYGLVVDLHSKGSSPAVPESSAKAPAVAPQPKEKTAVLPPATTRAEARTSETTQPKPKAESIASVPAQVVNPAAKAAAIPEKAPREEKTAKDDRTTSLSAEVAASAKERLASLPPAVPAARGPARPVASQPANAPEGSAPRTALPTTHGDRTLTRVLGLKIGRIVLDPGHGGRDTGTVGPAGVMEKDLVLDIAKELQKLLEDRLGAQVVMTRSDDSYVALEDRPLMANHQEADLFVSIHANSSTSRSVSGVETYFLDFARTDSAREVAARENASSDRNIRDLQNLVLKIAQADKLQESRELASTIQKNLYDTMHRLMPGTMNRGVRSAPFIVLIGAHMPSILAEVSFLSNPQDEKLLQKDTCRQSVALALFQGIATYMKSLGSALAVNHFDKN